MCVFVVGGEGSGLDGSNGHAGIVSDEEVGKGERLPETGECVLALWLSGFGLREGL